MSHARHDPPPPHPLPPPPAPLPPSGDPVRDRLADANERTWIQIGSSSSVLSVLYIHSTTGNVAETMGALDKALSAYEHALRHNPQSVYGLCCCANILRIKEKYSSVRALPSVVSTPNPACTAFPRPCLAPCRVLSSCFRRPSSPPLASRPTTNNAKPPNPIPVIYFWPGPVRCFLFPDMCVFPFGCRRGHPPQTCAPPRA